MQRRFCLAFFPKSPIIDTDRQSRSPRVAFSAGETGSCFPDERAACPQCGPRIPLPHTGTTRDFLLCGFSDPSDCRNKKEVFLCTPHPFSARYWRDAADELRDLRKLLFAALMIAMCIVLAQIPSVPLFGGARVTWGFLARSVCAWVCGPVLGLLFAFAEDNLSFFLTGGGGYPYFPGYTLTTMLGCSPTPCSSTARP